MVAEHQAELLGMIPKTITSSSISNVTSSPTVNAKVYATSSSSSSSTEAVMRSVHDDAMHKTLDEVVDANGYSNSVKAGRNEEKGEDTSFSSSLRDENEGVRISQHQGIASEKSGELSASKAYEGDYEKSLKQDRSFMKNVPTSLPPSSSVPSSQFMRAVGFARLGIGLAAGTVTESLSRLTGIGTSESGSSSYPAVASQANADRLAATLCRMRGAALKIGQMLSIQDETTILPPTIAAAMQSVRQGANPMPEHQLFSQLDDQIGSIDKEKGSWRDRVLHFNENPIAAASIGQVHEATLFDGSRVAIKVQYPGVADSIESDLSNLEMLMRLSGFAPPGLFLEEVIRVGRKELLVECNYEVERENQLRYKRLLENDEELSAERFVVPYVVDELSSREVLTTEFAVGGTIDKVHHLSQEERNRIGRNILKLTMRELFEWRFMNTDPNWGNMIYDVGTGTTTLIDFGAAREFDKEFVDGYLQIVWANANEDRELLLHQSRKLGFLTGEENDLMVNAHIQSGFIVGEPFSKHEPYDFRASRLSARMQEHGSVFMQHRLTPPPEEVYTLHRKLVGAYMLCIKLGAIVQCRDLLENLMTNYNIDDKEDAAVG